MAEEWDGRERRKYPRVPLKGEVKGKIHTVSAAPVVDLSVEGALLEVPCVLEPKTLYTLRLAVGPTEQLEVKGESDTKLRTRFRAQRAWRDRHQVSCGAAIPGDRRRSKGNSSQNGRKTVPNCSERSPVE